MCSIDSKFFQYVGFINISQEWLELWREIFSKKSIFSLEIGRAVDKAKYDDGTISQYNDSSFLICTAVCIYCISKVLSLTFIHKLTIFCKGNGKIILSVFSVVFCQELLYNYYNNALQNGVKRFMFYTLSWGTVDEINIIFLRVIANQIDSF